MDKTEVKKNTLIEVLFCIFNQWSSSFKRKDVFHRALELAVASLLCYGRKTITSMAIFLKRSSSIPVGDYKFFSERKWETNNLFRPILALAVQYIPDDYITIGVDDTRLAKTGKKIPYATWGRAPLSPPFQTNLTWGLRELHFSILLPLYGKQPAEEMPEKPIPARAIPVRWINAPCVKRPGKRATQEQLDEYKTLVKTNNLSTLTMTYVKELRTELDHLGLSKKTLIIVGDGSFCNRICFTSVVERTIMIARCRKDAKLCFKAPANSKKFYCEEVFTPETVRQDEMRPWMTCIVFFGGAFREIRYKEIKNVFWRTGAKRRPLRLIVLAPTPYLKGGKRNYRNPAYLLSTDNDAPVEVIIQAYINRWPMEYCHRDAKSILGVGEAQVWNETSVARQPSFHVATYSALVLANVMVYGDRPHPDFGERPGWRRPPRRVTLRALVGKLRGDIEDDLDCLKEYDIEVERAGVALRQAA
jgi:hypothetical protein